jgi:hypothetical protein
MTSLLVFHHISPFRDRVSFFPAIIKLKADRPAIPIFKRKSAPTFTVKDNFRTHTQGAIALLDTSGLPELLSRKGLKRKSRKPPRGTEELERKARFFAKQKMRPKSKSAVKAISNP